MVMRGSFQQTLETVFINTVGKKKTPNYVATSVVEGYLTFLLLRNFITHMLYGCNLIRAFGLPVGNLNR